MSVKVEGTVVYRKEHESGSWRVGVATDSDLAFFTNVNEEPPPKGQDYIIELDEKEYEKQKEGNKKKKKKEQKAGGNGKDSMPRYVALKAAVQLLAPGIVLTKQLQINHLREATIEVAERFEEWLKS